MNNMLRKFFLIFLILFTITEFSYAQDPHFSQFYANSLYLNPALAGSVVCPRLNLNYRNQWPAISGTFITYSASYDQHIDVLNGGIGVLVYSDRQGAGTLSTTNFSGIYSYRLEVSRNFSLKAGYKQHISKKFKLRKINFS